MEQRLKGHQSVSQRDASQKEAAGHGVTVSPVHSAATALTVMMVRERCVYELSTPKPQESIDLLTLFRIFDKFLKDILKTVLKMCDEI